MALGWATWGAAPPRGRRGSVRPLPRRNYISNVDVEFMVLGFLLVFQEFELIFLYIFSIY